jgi:putative ABC transport system permease protein
MHTVVSDIRFALRSLLAHPAFTAVIVATLALGIGANTAIFSVVNAALLRPLPFRDAERLVLIWGDRPASGYPQLPVSLPNFTDLRNRARSFDDMAVWTSFNESRFSLTGACGTASTCEPEKVQYAIVSSNLFSVLGARPAVGEGFLPIDDQPASVRGVMVSHRLWERRFTGRRSIDRATITLDGVTRPVLGVLPATFQFVNAPREPDVWVPLGLDPFRDRAYARGANALGVVAKLRDHVSPAAAQAELTAIAADLAREQPQFNRGWTLRLVALREQAAGGAREALLVLLGAVALVLLIGCANVANLLLARASTRYQEIAVRAALGASRGRLVAQLMTESVLLAVAGGAAGLLVAAWLVELPAAVPLASPSVFVPYAARPDDVTLDGTVLAFTMVLSIATGLIFGLVPALRASRPSLYSALASRGHAAGDPGRVRTRQLLVIAEVAVSLTLLIGAGLLLRSFIALRSVDPGFDAERVVTVDVDLPASRYPDATRQAQFFHALLARVGALPTVVSAGAIEQLPLSGPQQTSDFRILGAPAPNPGEEPDASYSSVTPGYFAAMSLGLVRGRLLGPADGAKAPRVAVINQTMAQRFWPNEDPIGKRVALSIESLRFDRPNAPPRLDFEGGAREIVGVVADVRSSAITEPPLPALYVPFAQRPVGHLSLAVRTACVLRPENGGAVAGCDPARLVAPIRAAVRAIDPDQPISAATTMSDVVAASVRQPRDRTTLLSAFAAVALLLAAVGVYGVMAYGVTERTREIGVRVALGAVGGDVVRLVVGGALRMTAVGIMLGLLGGLATSRLLGSMLYGVTARDLPTYIVAPLVIFVVGGLASWLPARRAARVDPAIALRNS